MTDTSGMPGYLYNLYVVFCVVLLTLLGPQGFWGSGENDYLFSGSWGAMVIIFRDLGSKLIV